MNKIKKKFCEIDPIFQIAEKTKGHFLLSFDLFFSEKTVQVSSSPLCFLKEI